MNQVKAAFISFGFFAYPLDFIKENSKRIFEETRRRGLDADYFGPVIDEQDAARVLEEMKASNYDFVIAHITTWTTSPIAIRVLREYKEKPILIWGIGGRTDEDGTLISPASAAGTSALIWPMKQLGMHFRYIYDHPDCEPKYDEVLKFAKLIGSIKKLNGSKVGAMGYCDMGLYSLMIDGLAVKKHLGMDIEDIFSYEVAKIADEAPKESVEAIVSEIRSDLHFDREPTFGQLEKTARLTYALRQKVKERGYIGVTMKCVWGVSRYMGLTPCLTQALLAKNIASICESDAAGLITQVILQAVTGKTASFLENYEYYPDRILVGVCGFTPFQMFGCEKTKCMCSGWGGFTGIYETEELKAGKITIARLFSEKGKLKMMLLSADAEVPGKWAELGWTKPMPKFPSLLLKLNCPVEYYAENMPAQHINYVYDDWGDELREFCKFTDIEVVEYPGK